MAVCRVEKNKNYTTMSNYHLRDPNLSNKARGLLSTMLSLPDNWDYTTRGLAKICKDGVDGITAQLRELEQYGYLIRNRMVLSITVDTISQKMVLSIIVDTFSQKIYKPASIYYSTYSLR